MVQPVAEDVPTKEDIKQELTDIPIEKEAEIEQTQVEQPVIEEVPLKEDIKQEQTDIPTKQEAEVVQAPLTQNQIQVEQPITEEVPAQEDVKQETEVKQIQSQDEKPTPLDTQEQQAPIEQPQIPEPEIPNPSDLQKIFEQIPNQEETNSSTAP